MRKALGLIETIGLVGAIEAADAAVKAANVILLGYENTKGSGKITVKIVGNVGAVKAGVAAGVAAATRVGPIYGHQVIARPHEEIESLIRNLDRGRGFADEAEVGAGETAVSPAPPAPEPKTTAAEEPEAEAKQCAATTKSGKPCKLPAQPGSDYCFVHGKQADAD